MRLISRAEEQHYLDSIRDARAEAERVRTLNAELLDRLMKAQGTAPAKPLAKRPTDRITEVIGDVAGSNHQLRKQLGAFARLALADKKDEDEIVHALLHWGDDDGGTPE